MKLSSKAKLTILAVLCTINLCTVCSVASAEEPYMLINYGVSGSWYEPVTSGQGFIIEIIPSSNLLAAYWFTYPVNGGDRDWYLATGDIDGNSAELTIYQTENGVFDESSIVVTNIVGSAHLEFTSCSAANLSYQIDSLGIDGEIPLQRIALDEFCEKYLATANTSIVSDSNSWVDIHGEWLFEGCVNLENLDSHGNELFNFTNDTVTLNIERYSKPNCEGPVSHQIMTLDMQRFDKTLALLDGKEVIANRFILMDVDSGQEIRQLFYVFDDGTDQFLTHGLLGQLTDNEGFPTELPSLFFRQLDTTP